MMPAENIYSGIYMNMKLHLSRQNKFVKKYNLHLFIFLYNL